MVQRWWTFGWLRDVVLVVLGLTLGGLLVLLLDTWLNT